MARLGSTGPMNDKLFQYLEIIDSTTILILYLNREKTELDDYSVHKIVQNQSLILLFSRQLVQLYSG